MSTFTDTTVSPKRFRQLISPIEINDNNFFDDLWNLFLWFRGDQRLGSIAQFSQAASLTQTNYITPPDLNEEWEIQAVSVRDASAIDTLDQVVFFYNDNIAASVVDLQSTLMSSNIRDSSNVCTFPNKDNNVNQVTRMNNAMTGGNLIVRKRDNTTPWLQLGIVTKTTATVGTRQWNITWVYRRRPVS
jgi:hypothetical protein